MPLLKTENGCNKDVSVAVFEMDCVRCEGTDRNCRACKGSGIEYFYRCPIKLITPDIVRFFGFYGLFKQGFLPVAGGILDQSASFISAIKIVSEEIESNTKKE